jgi:hypothetical protein
VRVGRHDSRAPSHNPWAGSIDRLSDESDNCRIPVGNDGRAWPGRQSPADARSAMLHRGYR